MVIFWSVTPIASAIFTKSEIKRTFVSVATTTAGLRPLNNQFSVLNADFMMTAYEHLWLGQDLPAFTTAGVAIAPFHIEPNIYPPLLNESWTAATNMYSTTLSCKPAITTKGNDATDQGYDNGRGCVVDSGVIGFEESSPFAGLYIGYYSDQHTDYALSQSGCAAPNNSHTFLAIWASNLRSQIPNITALFCEPAYWVQSVNATVTVPNMAVSNIVPLASPVPLASEMFNVSNFEYLIGTGAMTNSQRSDISRTTSIIDQRPRLRKLGINSTITNMVGFAVGASRLELADYLDAETLGKSFEKAHKLLFALAVRNLFTADVRIAGPRPGIVQGSTNAVVVIRVLAITVEALLGLITVFAVALMAISWTRRSQLGNDPASVTDLVGMMTPSISLGGINKLPVQSLGATPPKALTGIKSFEAGVLQLADEEVGDDRELSALIQNGKMYLTGSGCDLKQQAFQRNTPETYVGGCGPVNKKPRLFRPLEMTWTVAGIFIAALLLALTSLAVLHSHIQKHLGLPLPSKNPVVTNIVLNYIPVVLATFLEPFWVLLNRLLCVLKPFEELRRGEAKASESLDLKYTSLPPQLVIYRALRSRHFLLAAVCAISISANVLAVSLSGLFQTDIVTMEGNSTFPVQYLPVFKSSNGTTGSDHIYIAKSNFTDRTALPPWVSRDRFFLPFGLDTQSSLGEVQAYRATTQGFGIKVQCVPADLDPVSYIMNAVDRFIVPQLAPGGRSVECQGIIQPMGGQNNSKAALEVLEGLSPVHSNASQEDHEMCNTMLVAGFLRANLTVPFDDYKTDNTILDPYPEVLRINTVSSLWLTCRPTFLTAPYEVTVDTDGRIQTYTRQAPYSSDLGPYFSDGFNITNLIYRTSWLLTTPPDSTPYWHNDTFVDSWFGYFIKTLSNSSLLVDPSAPLPASGLIAPLVEDIYTRLFAIILGLHPDWFSPAPAGTEIPGTMLVPCTRVFMSRPMLIIAVTLISLNVIVAVAYYSKRPRRMLDQMPNTIASVVQLFEGSGLIAEKSSDNGWREDWKFGYGRFVGLDKRPHLGIERRPFVVPWADG